VNQMGRGCVHRDFRVHLSGCGSGFVLGEARISYEVVLKPCISCGTLGMQVRCVVVPRRSHASPNVGRGTCTIVAMPGVHVADVVGLSCFGLVLCGPGKSSCLGQA
jgi:hypothetical protein